MFFSEVLNLRRAIGVLALVCATIGTSGCGGGWGESKPAISASLTKGSQTVSAGQTATMTVTPTGTGPFKFQWYRNGVPISGAISSTYSSQVSGSDNGAVFTVAITNAGGTVTSAPYTLTVNTPPSITTQPSSQTVTAGQAATFTITASGTGPFSYQWFRDGAPIGGATSGTLTVPATAISDNGSQITVLVTNAVGSTTSSAATLSVMPASAGLTLAGIPVQTYGSGPFVVGATSASSGALTYAIVSGPAIVTGSTVTTTGAGDVVIRVTQAASGNFPASTATATFHVAQGVPSLSFASVPAPTYGGPAFPVSATSASTALVTYSVVSGPATVSGSLVTVTGAGAVVLTASQAATLNYTAATANTSFNVAAATPTLSFAAVPAQTFGNPAFTVSATSNSSASVTYSVVSGPATVSPGGTVTVTGAGNVVLAAGQAATANYAAATANISFNVAAATPTLSFAAVPAQTFGNPAFTVSATSNSSASVTYSVVSGPAIVSPGGTVTVNGVGTVVLAASQAATANYAAATANISFNVATAIPTLTFTSVPSTTYGAPAFPVSATSASSGTITYSVASGPATISPSGTVSVTGAGTVVIAASQAATANYAAATANTSFSVGTATPTLTFASVPSKTFGTAAFAVSATSASAGSVTYSLVSGPATVTSGGVVTITGAGTVIVAASQAATANYAAGTANITLTVNPAIPTLTFATLPGKTYGNPAFAISATSASSGAVTYSLVSGPATVTSGGNVTLTGAGPVTISATQAANGNYAAATTSTAFTVAPNVSISPITPASQVLAPGQLGFSATAVGGQTNNLVWTATGGSFTGSTWTTPTAAGTYTIRATSTDQSSVYVTTTATVSAPVITAQPVSQNVCTNASTTLSVAANYGSTYQWSLGGTVLPGANSSSYFIAGAASLDAGTYSATVTNPAGSVTSNLAKVVVGSSLTSNPANLSIFATQTASFSVSVSGIGPFTYRWYRVPSGGSPVLISGATSSTYITAAISLGNNADQYYATVTDGCGTVLTSSHATLTVTNANVPPTIITQPLGMTTVIGGTPTFVAVASGTPSLSYQWFRIPAGSVTGSAVAGATSASYTVPVSMTNNSNDQDQYYVLVTNSYGQAVSQNAPLVVGNGVMIQITDQPSTVYVNAGAPSTFSVLATSTLPLSYQWYKALPGSSTFRPIAGATSSIYTLAAPAVGDTGSVYHVVVSNGTTAPVTSSSASLFVGALASVPSCSTNWSMLGTTITSGSCGYQLTAATTSQFGEIVWPTLISTGNIRLAFTIATSNPSSPPADGFAVVLGDPSLGATLTSQGSVGEGLGARGIPGFVLAFDDFYNSAGGSFPQDPAVPYLGVGRGENALWENPYFNVNTNIPQLAVAGQTISHAYVVTIVQSEMTVTMDGTQVFSGRVSVPPVAYLYVTSSTGGSWEQTVISNISATVSAPSN